jgi:hypothetical protein
MMLLILVRLLLLLLMLVVMMLTPPTPLSHLLWSLLYLLWSQLLMSSMRASPTMRSPCWRESFVPCTSSARRGGDLLGGYFECVDTSHFIADCPKRKKLDSSSPPTSMTTPSGMTTAWETTRRSTALGTRRRRNSRRSCPEHVLP